MFDNLKNMAGIMGQAKEMKQKMEAVQESLSSKTVSAESGAGAVTVIMNGKFEVMDIKMDPVMIVTLAGEGVDADQQMIQDLIVAACRGAHVKAQQLVQDEMAQVTGGLNLPGLDQMFK
ncbi:MAG: YbaB/EbfC family nucleoid-associated protein [Phycisphaeraceae bacterium]|nr:YbaB/EbfC family nucleoid-associated protein [Phycisphaeraceae bacterium]